MDTQRENKEHINDKKLVKKRRIVIAVLFLIGIGAIEFPGIFFVMDKVYPFVLGLPFLYGYVLCWWAYLCLVFFYAYKTQWGRKSFFSKKNRAASPYDIKDESGPR